MPRVAEGGRGGRGGSSGGAWSGPWEGRAGNRGRNQQKTSRGAVRLRIEPDPDEDDTTPSGRKGQHNEKGGGVAGSAREGRQAGYPTGVEQRRASSARGVSEEITDERRAESDT